MNALPSVYRTRLVSKAADDAPRVFALLVLSLITLGGGEMSAGVCIQVPEKERKKESMM